MKSNVKKKFGICAVDILLAQVLFSVISPLIAMADINHPEQVSVEYSDTALKVSMLTVQALVISALRFMLYQEVIGPNCFVLNREF